MTKRGRPVKCSHVNDNVVVKERLRKSYFEPNKHIKNGHCNCGVKVNFCNLCDKWHTYKNFSRDCFYNNKLYYLCKASILVKI